MALKPQYQLPRLLAFFSVLAENRGQVDDAEADCA